MNPQSGISKNNTGQVIVTLKKFFTLVLCISFLLSTTSCIVQVKKDNGKHKGWYKNPNNPKNPHTTNPEKSKGKSKK